MSPGGKGAGGFLDTLKHSRNYFGASLASKALGFLSIPVLTRILSQYDYGVFNVFNSYLNIFMVLLTLNAHTSVSRYFFEKKKDFKEFFGTSVLFSLGCFTMLSACFIPFQDRLAGLLGVPPQTALYLPPLVLFGMGNSFFEQIFAAENKSLQLAIRNIIQSYAGFALMVVFILLLPERKYRGYIWAQLVLGLLFTFYYGAQLRPYFKAAFRSEHLRYIATFSIPLIPYTLSGVILAQFDRIMINHFRGASFAGLYSLAQNIGLLLSLFAGALFQAWTPKYFQYIEAADYQGHDKDTRRLMCLIFAAAGVLLFFGKEMGMLLAPASFHDSLKVIPLIVVGNVFAAIFTIYGRNIGYAKKTYYSSLVVLIPGAGNIALNYVFIPRFGYLSAGFASMISYLLMAFLAWFVSKAVLGLYATPLRVYLVPMLVFLALVPAYYALEFSSLGFLSVLGCKIPLVSVFLFVMARMVGKRKMTGEIAL